ncbi:MAG: hypothetical protein ACERKV_14415 [Clostridiaceae bacterium]
MKSKLKILLTIIIVFILVGCSNEGNKVINQGEILNTNEDGIGKIYEMNMLTQYQKAVSLSFNLEDIKQHISSSDEIISDKSNENYLLIKLSDGSYIYLLYDKKTKVIIYHWHFLSLYSTEEFEKLIPGKSTLSDVQKLDPYASFADSQTEHKLKNGKIIFITYIFNSDTGTWLISDMNIVNDDSGFHLDEKI